MVSELLSSRSMTNRFAALASIADMADANTSLSAQAAATSQPVRGKKLKPQTAVAKAAERASNKMAEVMTDMLAEQKRTNEQLLQVSHRVQELETRLTSQALETNSAEQTANVDTRKSDEPSTSPQHEAKNCPWDRELIDFYSIREFTLPQWVHYLRAQNKNALAAALQQLSVAITPDAQQRTLRQCLQLLADQIENFAEPILAFLQDTDDSVNRYPQALDALNTNVALILSILHPKLLAKLGAKKDRMATTRAMHRFVASMLATLSREEAEGMWTRLDASIKQRLIAQERASITDAEAEAEPDHPEDVEEQMPDTSDNEVSRTKRVRWSPELEHVKLLPSDPPAFRSSGTPSTSAHDTKLNLPQVAKFSGQTDKRISCPKVWFRQVLDYLSIHDRDFVKHFPFYLEGDALKWQQNIYHSLREQGQLTEEAVKKAFMLDYGNPDA